MTKQELFDMKLHEEMNLNKWIYILRVYGGWIYLFSYPSEKDTDSCVFVPEAKPMPQIEEQPKPSKGRKEAEHYISECSPNDYEGMKLFYDNLKISLYEAFDYIDRLEAENKELTVKPKRSGRGS